MSKILQGKFLHNCFSSISKPILLVTAACFRLTLEFSADLALRFFTKVLTTSGFPLSTRNC